MLQYRNPGVYIEEKPSGARPIEVAGTSTAAFLGYAATGDSKLPTPLESFDHYVKAFGEISENGTEDGDRLALSVRAFFDNGGRRAYVVNVSSGGERAHADSRFGRPGGSEEPVPMLTARARGIGLRGNQLEVWLVPRGDLGSDVFDVEVYRRRGTTRTRLERYRRVTLAPGTSGSMERVLAASESRVGLELDQGLDQHVFPSTVMDFATTSPGPMTIHIAGMAPGVGAPSVDFTDLDLQATNLAEHCAERLNSALSAAGFPGNERFRCELTDSPSSVRCILATTREQVTFTLNVDGAVVWSSDGPRANLFDALLGCAPDHQAVRSGQVSTDLTALVGQRLSVRIGPELGRTLTLPRFSPGTTLEDVADHLQKELSGDQLQLCSSALPRAEVVTRQIVGSADQEVLVLALGPDSPVDAGISPVGGSTWAPVPAGAPPRWELILDSTSDQVASFTLDWNGDSIQFGITIPQDSADPRALVEERINETVQAMTAPARDDLRVEAIGDELLVWSRSHPVTVLDLDSADGLALGHYAHTDGLSTLQRSLPIIIRLRDGEDGRPGTIDDYRQSFRMLEDVPDVAIICVPNHPWSTPGSRSIIEAAIAHCERQQDRMVIVDPPVESILQDVGSVQNLGLPTSSHSALYYPWVRVPIPMRDKGPGEGTKSVSLPPSGLAAGVWSRIDHSRGVWKAPAGVDARLRGMASLERRLTDIQSGDLNVMGVNTLRDLPSYGSVVWGARTLATIKEPEWKYLCVRRLALMIEDSLKNNLAWAVHQPNRSDLWASLRLTINAFLGRLHAAGAFQPDSATDAYFVECGKGTSMSQADIDAGIVRVRVGIAPVKPAEFIVITIEQINENS